MKVTECPPCWFILPESNGPISVGVCRYCEETREFRNSGEPGNYNKVLGKVALQKKNRKDGGDHHHGGLRVPEPRGE